MSAANRGAVWSESEVKALIAVWGESNVQEELDGAVRNKVVFQEIAKKLQEQGYNRDWVQCRTKKKNLKKGQSEERLSIGKGSQWRDRERETNL